MINMMMIIIIIGTNRVDFLATHFKVTVPLSLLSRRNKSSVPTLLIIIIIVISIISIIIIIIIFPGKLNL